MSQSVIYKFQKVRPIQEDLLTSESGTELRKNSSLDEMRCHLEERVKLFFWNFQQRANFLTPRPDRPYQVYFMNKEASTASPAFLSINCDPMWNFFSHAFSFLYRLTSFLRWYHNSRRQSLAFTHFVRITSFHSTFVVFSHFSSTMRTQTLAVWSTNINFFEQVTLVLTRCDQVTLGVTRYH